LDDFLFAPLFGQGARRALTVNDAHACGHPLHATLFYDAVISARVSVVDATLVDERNRLETTVGVRSNALNVRAASFFKTIARVVK